MRNPFRYFNSSAEVIRPTVIPDIRYPVSLRRAEAKRAGTLVASTMIGARFPAHGFVHGRDRKRPASAEQTAADFVHPGGLRPARGPQHACILRYLEHHARAAVRATLFGMITAPCWRCGCSVSHRLRGFRQV